MVIMPMRLPAEVHEGGAEWGQDPASSSIFPWLHWVWGSTRTAWASIHSNQIPFFRCWHISKKIFVCFYPRNAKRHFQKKKKVKDEDEDQWFPIMAEPEWTLALGRFNIWVSYCVKWTQLLWWPAATLGFPAGPSACSNKIISYMVTYSLKKLWSH